MKTQHDWDKVSKIRLAQTQDRNFLETLHDVQTEQVDRTIELAGKRETSSEKKKLQIDEEPKSNEASGIPELQNLMQDSVISMANLSEVETPRAKVADIQANPMSETEKEIIKKYDEMK